VTKNKRYSSCFIIAPSEVNLQAIIELFNQRDIQCKNITSMPETSFSIMNLIQIDIQEADFICGVITKELPSHVYFEIGYAYGLKKPMFLIVDKDTELHSGLTEQFYMNSSITDINAIQFNLDNFLNMSTKSHNISKNKNVDDHFTVNNEEFQIFSPPQEIDPRNIGLFLDSYIRKLLNNYHILFVRNVKNTQLEKDSGVDLAIWLDGLKDFMSNPVLIDIKSGILSENQLIDGENRLRNYILKTKSSSNVGILLYYDKTGRIHSAQPSGWPLVFRMNINEFTELIITGKISNALIEARNIAVHGVQ
jgi:nucleoside 2-deoxyribosyltransferase